MRRNQSPERDVDIENLREKIKELKEYIQLIAITAKAAHPPVELLGKEIYKNIIPSMDEFIRETKLRLDKLEEKKDATD